MYSWLANLLFTHRNNRNSFRFISLLLFVCLFVREVQNLSRNPLTNSRPANTPAGSPRDPSASAVAPTESRPHRLGHIMRQLSTSSSVPDSENSGASRHVSPDEVRNKLLCVGDNIDTLITSGDVLCFPIQPPLAVNSRKSTSTFKLCLRRSILSLVHVKLPL